MHNTTVVTALFDLGRNNLTEFKRDFTHYLDRLKELLESCSNPMCIYIEPENVEFVWKYRKKSNTKVIPFTKDMLKQWFTQYGLCDSIRNDPKWYKQADWLEKSPQCKLDLYNPLVMSKMFMLNDQSINNDFSTDYVMWVDAGITSTVGKHYFQNNIIDKLEKYFDPFLFIAFPYEGGYEIHGFRRDGIKKYTNNQEVNRVCRGGMFGGKRSIMSNVNSTYYRLLDTTLNAGYMGTEESIFSIMSYTEPYIKTEMINADGLIYTFLDRVSIDVKTKDQTNVYIITYNSPPQLKLLLSTITNVSPQILKQKLYLINNSTDRNTDAEYNNICVKYGMEHIQNGNMGICGGRQWAADHFNKSDSDYMMWFEDDMLLYETKGVCKNGLTTYVDDLFNKAMDIVKQEKLDFLKLSFSEFYGEHHENWAFYNVPQSVKDRDFKDGHRMNWSNSGCCRGTSYIMGEVYYSNWPSLMTKEGNRKIFLDPVYDYPYEQTIMSHAYTRLKEGKIKSGVLLASPINHNRVYHYTRQERKEV